MTEFVLTTPSVGELCVLSVRKPGAKLKNQNIAHHPFVKSDAAEELENLTAFINQHRSVHDLPAETILASTGIAKLIFETASK